MCNHEFVYEQGSGDVLKVPPRKRKESIANPRPRLNGTVLVRPERCYDPTVPAHSLPGCLSTRWRRFHSGGVGACSAVVLWQPVSLFILFPRHVFALTLKCCKQRMHRWILWARITCNVRLCRRTIYWSGCTSRNGINSLKILNSTFASWPLHYLFHLWTKTLFNGWMRVARPEFSAVPRSIGFAENFIGILEILEFQTVA